MERCNFWKIQVFPLVCSKYLSSLTGLGRSGQIAFELGRLSFWIFEFLRFQKYWNFQFLNLIRNLIRNKFQSSKIKKKCFRDDDELSFEMYSKKDFWIFEFLKIQSYWIFETFETFTVFWVFELLKLWNIDFLNFWNSAFFETLKHWFFESLKTLNF